MARENKRVTINKTIVASTPTERSKFYFFYLPFLVLVTVDFCNSLIINATHPEFGGN